MKYNDSDVSKTEYSVFWRAIETSKSKAEYSVFWRAIETSKSVTLCLERDSEYCQLTGRHNLAGIPSGPILSQFLRGSPLLRTLDLRGFILKEEHCRALATLERTDLEVHLHDCIIEGPQDEEDTFIEWFRHNQIVTECCYCQMGDRILSALSGNNSVKKLTMGIHNQFFEVDICCLARALPGNMGIEYLAVCVQGSICEETWSLLFRSLSTHPQIKFLIILHESFWRPTFSIAAANTTRMHAILQMLRLNTVVHTIEVPEYFRDEAIYQNSILPRLEMNRSCFEVQRRAMKRADPSIRPQLLGRALHVVQYNPDLVFRFLYENVPAFVRTEEVEEREEESLAPLDQDPVIVSVAGQKRKASS
jgi:hypothetical protein